jgi:hypothetical protein
MKKLLGPLAVLVLLALAVPAFAEVELGISATPVQGGQSNAGGYDTITGFHVGYAWSIIYLSWDALAMPAVLVQNMTGHFDEKTSSYVTGVYAPGFLNLYDAGLRLVLQPFLVYAEVGTNNLYVYKNQGGGSFGANLRIGAGLRFNTWGVNLSGTSVFDSFDQLSKTLTKLASKDTANEAIAAIGKNIVPSINLTFYF